MHLLPKESCLFLPELHSDADIPSSAQIIQRDDSWVAPTRLHTPICESLPCRRKRAGKGSPGKRVFGKAQTMGRGGQQSAVSQRPQIRNQEPAKTGSWPRWPEVEDPLDNGQASERLVSKPCLFCCYTKFFLKVAAVVLPILAGKVTAAPLAAN